MGKQIYRTLSQLVVLYGCEHLYFICWDAHRLGGVQNKILRQISWEKQKVATGGRRKKFLALYR
jgi:hypothetical protein